MCVGVVAALNLLVVCRAPTKGPSYELLSLKYIIHNSSAGAVADEPVLRLLLHFVDCLQNLRCTFSQFCFVLSSWLCSFDPRGSAPEFFSLKKNRNEHFVAKVIVSLCTKFGVFSTQCIWKVTQNRLQGLHSNHTHNRFNWIPQESEFQVLSNFRAPTG